MAGALAERVFVEKIGAVGFVDAQVVERRAFGLDDIVRYPLFTADLVDFMRDAIPPEQQAEVATAVTVTARKP